MAVDQGEKSYLSHTAQDIDDAINDISSKQDALSFDGTYNASTNKAATVSTVTNATKNAVQVLVWSVTEITASTTLDDTGVSYTIPSGNYVRITATARYGQSNPEEIMIWTGSSVFAHTQAVSGDNNFALTATTLIGGISGDTTAKVYARFRSANTNAIILEVESVPNPSAQGGQK